MARIAPVRLAYNTFKPIIEENENLSPIIYMHGVTNFKENWGKIPQIIANATKRRAYALDARNHGDSEHSDVFNYEVNVDDLIHFMDTFKISRAILVGHSMGGVTAIRTALRWPERTEKIVVEDMVVRKLPKEVLNIIDLYMKVALQAKDALPVELDEHAAETFIVRYIRSNYPPLTLDVNDDKDLEVDTRFIAICRDENGRYRFKANMEVIEKAMADAEAVMTEPQGIFEGPTCFIYGKLSLFKVGEDVDHIKQFFPNAIFEGIEDARHGVHTDKPLDFIDALLKFICS